MKVPNILKTFALTALTACGPLLKSEMPVTKEFKVIAPGVVAVNALNEPVTDALGAQGRNTVIFLDDSAAITTYIGGGQSSGGNVQKHIDMLPFQKEEFSEAGKFAARDTTFKQHKL